MNYVPRLCLFNSSSHTLQPRVGVVKLLPILHQRTGSLNALINLENFLVSFSPTVAEDKLTASHSANALFKSPSVSTACANVLCCASFALSLVSSLVGSLFGSLYNSNR